MTEPSAVGGLVVGPLLAVRFRFRAIAPEELVPAATWPPPPAEAAHAPAGPVMVSITYTLRADADHEAFVRALRGFRYARRRTGGVVADVGRRRRPGPRHRAVRRRLMGRARAPA